ncbi:hypothetical protein PHYBLDRAFT_138626 [Phycomyces blakesleeanus NRRL 1555(-)]|uniref:Uncharacterized protein n=1 Tax=Phycomyces blakesleeanus (strain ATCC 8743b / DSM 1359 / FGSC 10004 / NBRC 33097 / NRRL 1555) TaxID=763407 RepID=A0A167R885_PHYB8|nr:hypothetical protein PHYBLDRAFT_138626 [Phycomyces blakesleeanus NRRL 1555(-)]OAD81084.1 hypothetical protein PHYBLDRAFT_138626 [Phycomyces blakesleeanus NRRL 1555(-)]|eukprot:XP_018299124.1 hypothetical protein PHYBLDRAFT_138626 [Phycomyces blakesleeanus NRRL 1555(-)]
MPRHKRKRSYWYYKQVHGELGESKLAMVTHSNSTLYAHDGNVGMWLEEVGLLWHYADRWMALARHFSMLGLQMTVSGQIKSNNSNSHTPDALYCHLHGAETKGRLKQLKIWTQG